MQSTGGFLSGFFTPRVYVILVNGVLLLFASTKPNARPSDVIIMQGYLVHPDGGGRVKKKGELAFHLRHPQLKKIHYFIADTPVLKAQWINGLIMYQEVIVLDGGPDEEEQALTRQGPDQATEADRREADRREEERKEAERKEAERKEAERKEAERTEAERKEAERKEAEQQEAQRKAEEERLRREEELREAERKRKEEEERKRQELERRSATMLQSVARMFLERKKYKLTKRKIITLQAVFRKHRSREDYLRRRKLVVWTQAHSRGFLARRVRDGLAYERDRLRRTLNELLTTEISYVDSLHIMTEVFQAKFEEEAQKKRGVVEKEAVDRIFSNVAAIRQLHDSKIAEFQSLLTPGISLSALQPLGDLMRDLTENAKIYTTYVNNFDDAQAELNKLQAKKEGAFALFLKELDTTFADRLKGRDLRCFLIMPVQRIMRYAMLLQDTISHVPEFYLPCRAAALRQSCDACYALAAHVNESKRWMEGRRRLKEIEAMVKKCPLDLVNDTRLWVHEGEVEELQLDTKGKEMNVIAHHKWFFLFTDLLLIAKHQKKPTRKKGQVPKPSPDKKEKLKLIFDKNFLLASVGVTDLPDQPQLGAALVQLKHHSFDGEEELLLRFQTEATKSKWMLHLTEQIEVSKKDDAARGKEPGEHEESLRQIERKRRGAPSPRRGASPDRMEAERLVFKDEDEDES